MSLGQSSFRRILLSRLLLLSLPVLLIGVSITYEVTYRKARSALLETARQNLTESAVRNGENIARSIEALEASLVTATDTIVLKLSSPEKHQTFLEQIAQKLPNQIECVQLTDLQAGKITASTCGDRPLTQLNANLWPKRQPKDLPLNLSQTYVKPILPEPDSLESRRTNQLELLMAAPVYNTQGNPRYALCFKTILLQEQKVEPGSLAGYPVIINESGTILAHPLPSRVGRNIDREEDAERLQVLMKNAIAGQQYFLHLFSLEKNGVELVAGYSSIESPITDERGRKWIVLAVTSLDNALSQLKQIQDTLFLLLSILVLALIATSILATLYISGELALPLEKLRDYALNRVDLHSSDRIPTDRFQIKEIKQLSIALNQTIERLKTSAEQLEIAWKEAKNANKLKNEFLATTSHELRTPLNGIINSIRIIKDGYCDSKEEEIEFLAKADAAAIHLLEIINDVLDIAKIEAGKLSVNIEPVELAKLLKEVIDLQILTIHKKGLILKNYQEKKHIVIYADRAKLKQVLINVFANAVKFTETGSITINTYIQNEKDRIKQNKEEKNNSKTSDSQLQTQQNGVMRSQLPIERKIIIEVKDTGIGIPLNQQDKLFRPFVMVDGSTTRRFSGTGLGLAISRNLIELMGGSINLFSQGEGKGTTVKITLPLAKISEDKLSCL
jgi:signal transduction histidine kinase